MGDWQLGRPGDATLADLESVYGFKVRATFGDGFPPLETTRVPRALLPGSHFMASRVQERELILIGVLYGATSEADFHVKRKALVRLTKPRRK
jgi:hypothetical protein